MLSFKSMKFELFINTQMYRRSTSSVPSPLVVLLLVRAGVSAFCILAVHGSSSPLPHVLPDNTVHTANIVSRLAHVIEPGSPRSLGLPLHHLDSLHIWRIDLVAHLDAHARQVVAQQDGRVDFRVALLDVEAHAGEGVTGLLTHEQDVADTSAVDVVFAEKASAGACGIESSDLGGGDCSYGVGAAFAGGLDLGSNGDFTHADLEAVLLSGLRGTETLGGCRVASLQGRVLDLGGGRGIGASLLLLALGATLAERLFEAGQRPRRL